MLWGKDALLRLPSDGTPIVKERMAVLVAKQPPKGRSVELSLFRRPTQNQHKHEQRVALDVHPVSPNPRSYDLAQAPPYYYPTRSSHLA